jgi:hypothetical protein
VFSFVSAVAATAASGAEHRVGGLHLRLHSGERLASELLAYVGSAKWDTTLPRDREALVVGTPREQRCRVALVHLVGEAYDSVEKVLRSAFVVAEVAEDLVEVRGGNVRN